MAIEMDPECGMKVDTDTAPRSSYKGKTYYFCSVEDKTEFGKNPDKYSARYKEMKELEKTAGKK